MIYPTIEHDSFSPLLVRIVYTGSQKPVVGVVTNPYMQAFGWALDQGTGIYGPRKRRITIRAKGGGWLKFPPRDKYKGPGKWRSGISGIGHLGRDESGALAVFAKVTHPKGIKPKKFVEKALKQTITATPEMFDAVAPLLTREGAAHLIRGYCSSMCKRLRVKTAGLGSGRLSASFSYEVS